MHYFIFAFALLILAACTSRPEPTAEEIGAANAAGTICAPDWDDDNATVGWDCNDNAASKIGPLVYAQGFSGY
jgi:hypothetical protein